MNETDILREEIVELRAELKRHVAAVQSALEKLEASANRANRMIDALEEIAVDLAVEANFAHEKINSVLYQNPAIVEDVVRLEELLGPADLPTPDAPPHS